MRRSRILGLPVVVLTASLGMAPCALASRVIAPPGNSGVSQYVEVVPGAGGSTPVGAHGSHGPVLTAAQRHRLEAAGPSGKALAAFVQQTGVARSKSASSSRAAHGRTGGASHTGSARSPVAPPSLPSAPPAHATGPAGGGLGWGLPAALGGVALAAAGIGIARRRLA